MSNHELILLNIWQRTLLVHQKSHYSKAQDQIFLVWQPSFFQIIIIFSEITASEGF